MGTEGNEALSRQEPRVSTQERIHGRLKFKKSDTLTLQLMDTNICFLQVSDGGDLSGMGCKLHVKLTIDYHSNCVLVDFLL